MKIKEIKCDIANVEEKILQAVAVNNAYIQDLSTNQAFHNQQLNQDMNETTLMQECRVHITQ